MFGAPGLNGGLAGAPATVCLLREGENITLPAKGACEVYVGDVISVRAGGGGGYGNPLERTREDVVEDVQSGKVSLDAARFIYRLLDSPHSNIFTKEIWSN